METTEKQETALIPTLQLTPFEQTKENLIALASDYKNMVVTKDNMKEADKARLVLKNARLGISKTATANRKTIKEFLKNNNDATEEELIGTIEPTELALEAKIKTVKDAIAEEERIEAARIAKHKTNLENLKVALFIVTKPSTIDDIGLLKRPFDSGIYDFETYEEFSDEAKEIVSNIKETAKNRLELLEFQAAKRKQEEAAAQKLIDDEKAKQEIWDKEQQKTADGFVEELIKEGFDFDEPSTNFNLKEPTEITKTLLVNTANNIDSAILEGARGAISPLKTVPIGVVSENPLVATNIPLPTDKELLIRMATSFSNVLLPICEEKQGIQHVEYVKNMLSKLSEQTLKVAEKL